MIKLKAEVAGQEHELWFQQGKCAVSAEIDGRYYDVEVRDLGEGEYLLSHGDQVYNCRVETGSRQFQSLEVNIRGNDFAVRLIDPKRLRGTQSAGEHAKGLVQIIAPMPGKVVRVLVEVGAQVEAGAGIVVVEAMKMQNEMKSPKAGVVESLNAEVGATVNAGDVLAVVG